MSEIVQNYRDAVIRALRKQYASGDWKRLDTTEDFEEDPVLYSLFGLDPSKDKNAPAEMVDIAWKYSFFKKVQKSIEK